MRRVFAVGCLAVFVGACGHKGTPVSGDDIGPPTSTPTFGHDVGPLMAEHCVGCHHAGSVAFPFDSYDAVRAQGAAIQRDVTTRHMPPWPPSSGADCERFVGDRTLTDADIHTIDTWVSAGMPRGDDSALKMQGPSFGALDGITLELTPGEAYQPPSAADEYRCYPIDPKLDADAFITAYRVTGAAGIHHLQLWELQSDADVAKVLADDAAAPGPGFPCYEWAGGPIRFLTVWGPSDPVRRHPAGTGIRIRAGRELVLQVHYHNVPGPSQLRVGLALAPHVDEEALMYAVNVNGFTLPPRQPSTTVHNETQLPWDAKLWGVRGHMHYLGTEVHLQRHDAAGAHCLLSIPKWNPDWQLMYFHEKPLQLFKGDTLSTECTYDTMTRNDSVHDGATATDEMCGGLFYITGMPPQ